MGLEVVQLVNGKDGYVSLWHGSIAGSNREIGAAVARWGAKQLDAAPCPCADGFGPRAQRRFLKRHYPAYYERVRGVVEAFGLPDEGAGHDVASIWFDVGRQACSAAFVPRCLTADGHGRVLRNMDLGVDLTGDDPHPPSSRILALDMDPQGTYGSLSLVTFDLMGAMDGVNEKGLVVVCNSHRDCSLGTRHMFEPVPRPEAGLNELQVVRYLLDMCADVPEAKEALLSHRTYYRFTPCLYLIADAAGRSAVYERSPSGNRILFTETSEARNLVTNFAPSRFVDTSPLPEDDGIEQGYVYRRYRLIDDALAASADLTEGGLQAIAHSASFDALPDGEGSDPLRPSRTLWSGVYDIDARRLRMTVYAGERDGQPMRSEPVTLALGQKPPHAMRPDTGSP